MKLTKSIQKCLRVLDHMISDKRDSIIERIKSSVDIADVIGTRIKLDNHGKGNCPFHDDKNPSLSVNRQGQYFHCFGCGAGGDVIRFIELYEKKTFLEAIRALAQDAGIPIEFPSGQETGELEEQRSVKRVLHETAIFYAKKMPEIAREYLCSKRGISQDTIGKYMIGFAGGGLARHLTDHLKIPRKLCVKAGVVKEKDDSTLTDFFYNRIVFPHILRGEVVQITGRTIEDRPPKYLHLALPIEHFYNEEAAGNKEIVIVEGIFDCLSAEQAGHHSVALLGTHGAKRKDLSVFSKCERAYVCMDGDDAGKKAADTLGELLPAKAIIVELPEGQDVNDLFKTDNHEEFQRLLNNGKRYLDFRIEAVSELPQNKQKEDLGKMLPMLRDCSDFARADYVEKIRKTFHITKRVIENGIWSVKDEDIDNESTPNAPLYTIQEKEEALAILRDPNLIERFVQTTEKIGCVGEVNNRITIFFTLTSRMLDNPINLIVKGDSSVGKSYLVEKVSRLFPQDQILAFTTMTPKALYHRKDSLSHKALIIFERHGAEESDYSIRSLQSEKKLIISMPVKDPETQQLETKDFEIPGPIAYIETTTRSHLHSENETRCFEIYVDHSEEQTARILDVQRSNYGLRGAVGFTDVRPWIVAQQLLRPYRVIIPFANLIKFPSKPVRVRRDFQRFLALIEVSAILHQFQREKVIDGNEECVVASFEDYALAYSLGAVILQQTIKRLSPRAEELVGKVAELTGSDPAAQLKLKEITRGIGWDKNTVKKYLRECEDQGLIDADRKAKGVAHLYQFVRMPDIYDNLLLRPEQLQSAYEAEKPANLEKPDQTSISEVNPLNIKELIIPNQDDQGSQARDLH